MQLLTDKIGTKLCVHLGRDRHSTSLPPIHGLDMAGCPIQPFWGAACTGFPRNCVRWWWWAEELQWGTAGCSAGGWRLTGPATKDNTLVAREGALPGGGKVPASQNLPCLDRRDQRKQPGRSPGELILNPWQSHPRQLPSHGRGVMNQSEGQVPAPGSSDPRQMQEAFPRGSGPYHKPWASLWLSEKQRRGTGWISSSPGTLSQK